MIKSRVKLITTTPNIEGWKIEKYFGIVTHQIVIGANIFRDVFASFRDIFGGSVRGYQKDLNKMQEILINQLTEKASKLGANMILGLRLDYDDVSGGGKSMFMLTASGTAAYGVPKNNESVNVIDDRIESSQLKYEIEREVYLEKLKKENKQITSANDVLDLVRMRLYPAKNIIEYIHGLNSIDEDNYNALMSYFSSMPKKTLNKHIIVDGVDKINKNIFNKIINILKEVFWFDYNVIKYMLESENLRLNVIGLELLTLEPQYYQKEDVNQLESILASLNYIENKFPILSSTKNILGNEKKKWLCINCNFTNSLNNRICATPQCYSNYYGFKNDCINPNKLKVFINRKIKKLNHYYESRQ